MWSLLLSKQLPEAVLSQIPEAEFTHLTDSHHLLFGAVCRKVTVEALEVVVLIGC